MRVSWKVRGRSLATAVTLVSLCVAPRAVARDSTEPRELRFTLDEPWVDGIITGLAAGGWIASEALQAELMSSACRWCNPPASDTAVRDALRWSDTNSADKISDVLAYGAVPLAVVGAFTLGAGVQSRPEGSSPWKHLFLDLLVIAQATALAADVNQIAKIGAARERPGAHARAAGDPRSADDNRSFYSAHTSTSMAIAVSAGTVASMRGYRWAPALWAVLPALSVFTGYLRIASDHHYFSDGGIGGLAGATIGFVVP